MSWIASLDTRAARWPSVLHGAYLAVKWTFVGYGAFALLRLWLDRTGLMPLY